MNEKTLLKKDTKFYLPVFIGITNWFSLSIFVIGFLSLFRYGIIFVRISFIIIFFFFLI